MTFWWRKWTVWAMTFKYHIILSSNSCTVFTVVLVIIAHTTCCMRSPCYLLSMLTQLFSLSSPPLHSIRWICLFRQLMHHTAHSISQHWHSTAQFDVEIVSMTLLLLSPALKHSCKGQGVPRHNTSSFHLTLPSQYYNL